MQTKKNVVVIYYGDDWKKTAPEIGSETTKIAFEEWYERGIRHGLTMFRAHIDWYDVQIGAFKKAWTYNENGWVKIKKTIKPDLIYDKMAGKYDYAFFDLKMELQKKCKTFNSPLFRTIADSKLSQYLMFKEIMPITLLAANRNEMKKAFEKIKSNKIVLKPIYGSGGSGIIINERKKLLKNMSLQFPLLVQEFIKNIGGIPGFTKGSSIADLRMVFLNHKFMYALSRIAKKGSYFTNFHQGAVPIFVPPKAIPESAKKMAQIIINRFSIFPHAQYSIDFYFTDKKKPILMEVNTTPGFDLLYLVADEKIKEREMKELIKIIKE